MTEVLQTAEKTRNRSELNEIERPEMSEQQRILVQTYLFFPLRFNNDNLPFSDLLGTIFRQPPPFRRQSWCHQGRARQYESNSASIDAYPLEASRKRVYET